MKPYSIHWFRRDLRVAGNPALRVHTGHTLGVFCFDETFLSRSDFSWNRFGFFLKTLEVLEAELRQLGMDFHVSSKGPEVFFESLFEGLKHAKRPLPKTLHFCRDYEPFARLRDEKITTLANNYGVEVLTYRDHLLIEPEELLKPTGGYYQVYTPFSKRWLAGLPQERLKVQEPAFQYLESKKEGRVFEGSWKSIWPSGDLEKDVLVRMQQKTMPRVTVPLPEAGTKAAMKRLQAFLKSTRLSKYHVDRDFPAVPGTSQLSIYLKNGSLTSAMVLHALFKEQMSQGREVFIKEIIWREFYYHLLFHEPRVEREAFQKPMQKLRWSDNEVWFKAWTEGETGYPIVDAGMRELRTTGWMHNRVRMIVASFLTKDLQINWQWGEQFFMEHLLDGDLAPNNGGWQWAASTGCDAQPYFRIFNPFLQSKKFDPDGTYIRRFVETRRPHEPNRPIVDHAVQRQKTLEMFALVKNG